jgi:hypothetical protein
MILSNESGCFQGWRYLGAKAGETRLSAQRPTGGGEMLERWGRESIRDQPYNGIGGVARVVDVGSSDSGKRPTRRVAANSCS